MPSSTGSSTSLKSFETSFQQDLNGDGTIGAPAPPPPPPPPPPTGTIIESFRFDQSRSGWKQFFLCTPSGHVLGSRYCEISGADVYVGQFDTWRPIGVEQTGSGYEVAWKHGNADEYIIWGTDSSGNCVANLMPSSSGSSTALKSFETSFQQDLNGDGIVGGALSPPAIEFFWFDQPRPD